MVRGLAVLAISMLAVTWLAEPVWGRGQKDQRRLIDSFDFEERDGRNPNFEDLPRYWFVTGRTAGTPDPNFMQRPVHRELVTRKGFPDWNDVGFDTERAHSGKHSLRLSLDGGSAGAFLQIGALPAVPSSDYLISFQVNTTELKHARAVAVAYLVDSWGRRIEESVTSSVAVQTDNQWQKVNIKLYGDFVDAAWLVIELQLRQPAYDPDNPLGKKQIVLNEVHGSAWFDDVMIWQLPRVLVTTQSDVNIIRSPLKPRLSMFVRDLSGEPLLAEVSLYDENRTLVANSTQMVGRGSPPSWTWEPELPRLGWYLIDLNVYETQGGVARRDHGALARSLTTVLWLSSEAAPAGDDMSRFSIDAQGVPEDQLALLPELMRQTRLGSLVLSAWDKNSTRRTLDQRQNLIDEIFRSLPAGGKRATLSFYPLPEELYSAVQSEAQQHLSPLTLLTAASDNWMAYTTPVFMRHAQTVQRWQLGRIEDPEAFYRQDLQHLLDQLLGVLSEQAPKPQIVLPWNVHQSRRVGLDESTAVALAVGPGVLPETIPDYMPEWQEIPRVPTDLHLIEPPADQMSHANRVDDLARRVLYGWKASADGLTLPAPWTRVVERKVRLLPDPLLGVFTTMAQRLSGRRLVNEMAPIKGVRCMIFDGPRGGMLAVWSESADADESLVRMWLGDAPEMIDVWGNRQPVAMVNGKHELRVTRTPIFVEGVDTELAMFRAMFALNPSFIESIHAPQKAMITLRNPWDRTISGKMTITQPEKWYIEPRNNIFSIASGETAELPITVMFPISEVAGEKRFEARFDFVAEEKYQVDLGVPMTLGLEGIDLDATLTVDRDEATGIVTAKVSAMVMNEGTEPVSLFAFAYVPGKPRQRHIITELRPGQSVLRRFIFPDVADVIFDQFVRVGLTQTEGEAVLNKRLSIESPN